MPDQPTRPGQPLERGAASGAKRPRVLEVVGRVVGGAGVQAINLTRGLNEGNRFEATLVHGNPEPGEATVEHMLDPVSSDALRMPALRRRLGPWDLRALAQLRARIRRDPPDVVHTHAAKAGAVGRGAALLSGRSRPRVLVHTFHGHVLSGYFASGEAGVYRRIERSLAARSDRIVAVSDAVRDELVELGIAGRERIEVIPVGLDFEAFDPPPEQRAERRSRARAELGLDDDAKVVCTVTRLTPIKRVDRFLRVAELVAGADPAARFLIVGGGEDGPELRGSPEAVRLGERVIWLGQTDRAADMCFASEVAVLTSDSEGMPIALIEAGAAGLPVVGTEVGGVAEVIGEDENGHLVPRDESQIAAAILGLLGQPARAKAMGERGRERALGRYGLDRLARDTEALYRDLLNSADVS